MQNKILSAVIMSLLVSAGAFAQSSWRTIGVVVGATSAITSMISLSGSSGDSGDSQSESGESQSGESNSGEGSSDGSSDGSESQSNSKGNLVQIQDDYFEYLQDFKISQIEGRSFDVSDIKQPYAKELVLKIINDEVLMAKIEQEVEGSSMLEKINIVLSEGFKQL